MKEIEENFGRFCYLPEGDSDSNENSYKIPRKREGKSMNVATIVEFNCAHLRLKQFKSSAELTEHLSERKRERGRE